MRQSLLVQVKAVPSAEEAKKIVEALKAKGDKVFSRSVMIKGRGEWHRILVGHFETREEARQYMKQLRLEAKYPGAIIQKITSIE
jgi:cell division septation protein DedD